MKSVYIHSATSITNHETFDSSDITSFLSSAASQSYDAIQPEHKKHIDARTLRRASKLNKMALSCTAKVMDLAQVDQLDAIIVGTGLGCMTDTKKFIDSSILADPDALIPPAAFINSGHNAISGQIALVLKNHGYNMTHVQRSQSFDYALQDAMLRIDEGDHKVLLGALDEKIDLLGDLADELNVPHFSKDKLAEGASFFILSDRASSIEMVGTYQFPLEDWPSKLKQRLTTQGIDQEESYTHFLAQPLSGKISTEENVMDYGNTFGYHFSSPALGLHLAYDHLRSLKTANTLSASVHLTAQNKVSVTVLRHV